VLLADTLPEFAVELERLLARAGEPELASQVLGLVIVDRCRCEDSFCSSFHTQSGRVVHATATAASGRSYYFRRSEILARGMFY
jgi:hypothetical protein